MAVGENTMQVFDYLDHISVTTEKLSEGLTSLNKLLPFKNYRCIIAMLNNLIAA